MNPFRLTCHATAIVGALSLFSSTDVRACACCSDPGTYNLRTGQLTDYELTQLRSMEFASTAQLFLVDAIEAEDQVKGLAGISESYGLLATVEPKRWRLTFRTEDGKTGVLTLPLPSKMTFLAADIHHGGTSTGGGPLLYKEWRFEGTATGDGIFQEGFASPARYTLIFQGRGNKCDNGEDFTHWRIEVSGKKAAYAFFGELVSAVR